PSSEEFAAFLRFLDEHPGGGTAPAMARLMAFCGLRKTEACSVTWGDFDFVKGVLVVKTLKRRLRDSDRVVRRVPLIPEAREYFEPRSRGKKPDEAVSEVPDLRWWFNLAKQKGVLRTKLSNHDLRHLFATRCIESGVDIPTVARWLGHKDGGALAMKVYGHLRDEHSQRSAARVRFGRRDASDEGRDERTSA